MQSLLKLAFISLLMPLMASVCNPKHTSSKIYEVTDVQSINSIDSLLPKESAIQLDEFVGDINTKDIPYYISAKEVRNLIDTRWSGLITGKLTYLSSDVNGDTTRLSGRIYVGRPLSKKLKGIIIANHFTKAADKECPSNSLIQPEAIFTVFGYAVVMADYIGYGKTVDMEHPYLHWTSTAQSSIDAYLAMKQYLIDNEYEIGDELYNIGYSQGGEAAMAVLRLATEKYSDSIHFTKSFMGGGPYNIEATFDDVVSNNKTGIPYAMPMIINGLNCAYNLNLNLDEIFVGEMHDNYDKVLSKKYTSDELSEIFTHQEATNIFSEFMFDKTNPVTAKIMEAARQNNLAGTWTPKPGEKIYLLHSTTDDMVPFVNSELMAKALSETESDYEVVFQDLGSHVKGAIVFYLSVAGYLLK